MLLLKRLDDRAIRPTRHYPDDAGLDLHVMTDHFLKPGEFIDVETGWAVKVADNHWGAIKARSSTFFKRGIIVHEGVLDPGYTGKLVMGLYNPGTKVVVIPAGERLAQLIIIPLVIHPIQIVNDFPHTMRGAEGFGSTGFSER
jgi:dUTP pyrophosphatase